MTDPAPPSSPDPAAIQAGIAADRAQLLGGRGTGASQAEIDGRTRARPRLAGEPTPQHLATVARQTAIARGDAAAIALDIAAARDQLATTVQAIRERVSPSRVAGRQVRAVRERTVAGWAALRTAEPVSIGAAAGAALTVAVAVLLVIRRRGRRSLPAGRPGDRDRCSARRR